METSMHPPGHGGPDPVTAVMHLNAGKYFQIASVVILIYDHILTFPEEVERIWKQKLSGASILFVLNRYGNLMAFIVIVDAFNDPSWTKDVCARFAMFEGAQSLVFIAMVMILRVYALYGRSTSILAFLMTLWCIQVAISGVGISTGKAVDLPPGLVACILVSAHPLFPALWVAPLITDTCIFILTVYRIRPFTRRRAGKTPMIQIFIRDGVMYFLAIFTANLINSLIYFIAPEDLRALGASFSQILTSIMISRLILNLRSLREKDTERQITRSIDFGPRGSRYMSGLTIPRRQTGVPVIPGFGEGHASGWTDDPSLGVDSTPSGWRTSRGNWGDGNATGVGTVTTFMTYAIGNLGERFQDDDGTTTTTSGGTIPRDVERPREVDGRWVSRDDETELKVIGTPTMTDGPSAV